MSLRIFNTVSGKKEVFKPIKKGKVGMYVCGVTVYDECHIGHARGAFVFDVIRKYFENKGYKVKFVKNITDVDDKIIEKAKEETSLPWPESQRAGQGNQSTETRNQNEIKLKVKEIAERFTKSYYEDMDALGIEKASFEPRATEYIEEMVKIIKKLIKNSFAYVKDSGVYFAVRKFKDYGRLSKQSPDEMLSGARIEVDERKIDPLDFALWKSSKEGEPSWKSPWGEGRPGWHIECSAMSTKILGATFDIHGGGRDLVFPHHENEIAQSECATGKRFANYWIHNGLLTISGEKMAKSLGNFISVKDILKKHHPEVLKILFLSCHYRSPIDFSYEKMEEAKRARKRFYILFEKIDRFKVQETLQQRALSLDQKIDFFRKNFEEAMDDDFNTAEALGVLFELVGYVNKLPVTSDQLPVFEYAKRTLLELGGILGLFKGDKKMDEDNKLIESLIKILIDIRNNARDNKDFKLADKIRENLKAIGIILEDQKEGTRWRKASL